MTFLVSKDHRAILVPGDESFPVRIPTARPLDIQGKRLWAVPFNLREAIQLRHVGVPVPSPIGYYYGWPRDLSKVPQPFHNQLETAGFLTLNHRAYVLNEIGTGKTLSALWAADYLMKIGMVRKCVIVSPLSTLDRVWGDAVFEHLGHRNIAVLHGTAEKRRRLFANNGFDFYVINHDAVDIVAEMVYKQVKGQNKLVDARFLRDDVDLVIIDELAVLRNQKTNRWRIASKLLKPEMWAWGLTGTPTPNSPADAYAQVRLVTPDRVPAYFSAFRQQVMQQMTEYIWVPRREAARVVHDVMQPAIRFERDECFDLPPCTYTTRECELTAEQKKHYKEIAKELYTEIRGGKITAVNEGVKAGKLLQIACIGYNTPVLTEYGWIPIQEIPPGIRVWDGLSWIMQRGAIYRGEKPAVRCGGVWMTPDHKVLSADGWITAEEMNHGDAGLGLDWATVRLPYGFEPRWHIPRESKKGAVALPLFLRPSSCQREPKFAVASSTECETLRVSPWGASHNTRHVKNAPVQNMGPYAQAMFSPAIQGLAQLRRSWDNCLSRMAHVVRPFLARYAAWIFYGKDTGADRQRRPLRAAQLPVGNRLAAGVQSADESNYTHAQGSFTGCRSRAALWAYAGYSYRSTQSRVDGASRANDTRKLAVYDLVDCGPRSRFTVLGDDGVARIVHNCGVVYDKEGKEREVDASPRVALVRELIEQATNKVIVFVPFTAPLRMLHRELSKDFKCEMVYGDVSKAERSRIFMEFQKRHDLRVLIADAGTMSHGLTLTEANTIIWYGPTWSNDTYTQACGRITRPGQKNAQFITHVAGTEIEKRIYARLRERDRTQGVLLQMVKEGVAL